jgi:hypothetical protein
METTNARITGTHLGVEHGIMTFMIFLDMGGKGSQGAGGYGLDLHAPNRYGLRPGTKMAVPLLRAILELVGVQHWEDLSGEYVRVRAAHEKVHAIGHVMNDEWIDFDEFYNKCEEVF